MTDPLPDSPHCATIVVGEAITKLDALAAIATTVDAPVEQSGTARPFVVLAGGAWAEIDIPKFGEAPPLAIDVYSARSEDHAQASALALMAHLTAATKWHIRPQFTR